jgi:16S rRNA (guanine(966)-N(2))-methyltransferase RsmD
MRILGGSAKGRKIFTLKNNDVRPTGAKVRAAIFNMIAPHIYDSVFLDAFAGSGAMGIEALSRGAQKSIFLDINAASIQMIKKNVKNIDFELKSFIRKENFFYFIRQNNSKFDIIFADPPYAMDGIHDIVLKVEDANSLNDEGLLIIEHDYNIILNEGKKLILVKQKKYSGTMVSIYERTYK